MRIRTSLTTVATSRPTVEYAALVAIVWAVSGTVAPAHRPNVRTSRPSRWPTSGSTKTAAVPKTVIVAIAKLTSRSSARTTGAAAAIAELPQTAAPIPIRTATRSDTPSRRPAKTANVQPAAIVSSTSQNACDPIAAIDSKFSRRPSSTMPAPRMNLTAKRMPGSARSATTPALTTIRPSSIASGTSKPTASARGSRAS